MELRDVLWIGGATGSGKTSIARALAYRHDLQLYNVDHRTYDHVERLPPAPPPDWDRPPAELADRFVAHANERWRLVLEDLAGLPGSPGAIAEGPFLLPELVPPGATAVFLVPGEERLRATAAERRSRPVLVERNMLLAQRIAAAARERGFPVLEVDRPLAGMIERVGAYLSAALDALPRAVDRPAIRRFENDVLARQVRLYKDSGDAPGDLPSGEWMLPFACECGRPGCADVVELSLAEYERLSAAGDRSLSRAPRS
jgi:hypothetical protein